MDMKTFNRQQRDSLAADDNLAFDNSGCFPSSMHAHQGGTHRNAKPPEEEALANKLALEIEQLEAWLANQQNAQQGSVSVIPTIKSLIHTRKKLLKNIQASH